MVSVLPGGEPLTWLMAPKNTLLQSRERSDRSCIAW